MGKEISVLFVTTNLNYNGAKKYIVEVANELSNRGHKVGILYDSGPLGEKLNSEVIKYNTKLFGSGLTLKSRLKLILKAAFLARSQDYKIIHAESANSLVSHKLLSFISGVRVVETIHHVWSNPEERKSAAKKLNLRADKLIAISESVVRILAEFGLDKRKVSVIQNGIATKQYNSISKNLVQDLQRKLGIDKKDPVVVAVSRVNKGKNFEALVNWFPFVLSSFPTARFVIVGDNGSGDRTYVDQLIKKVKEFELSRNIIFVGGKSDVRPYLGLGNVFTITGLARDLSVMEAMATGLPVVVSKLKYPSKLELVKDGETGLLFKWGDWQKWAEEINFLLSYPEIAKKYGGAGKSRVNALFSIERYVDDLEKVYKNVLKI